MADWPTAASRWNSATRSQLEEVGQLDVADAEASCIDDEIGDLDTLDAALNDVAATEARVAIAQALLDCRGRADGASAAAQGLAANLELLFGGQVEITPSEGECLLDVIVAGSPDPARTMAVGDQPEDIEVVLTGMETCLDEESVAVLAGEAGSGPQDYGDDERLDGQHDDCRLGDERACDLLYLNASIDSDYSDYGASCGRRRDPGPWTPCTPGIELDATGYASLDDAGLATLVEDCQAGHATACDLAFLLAPIGSEAADVGFTCGGRMAIGALPDCRTRVP